MAAGSEAAIARAAGGIDQKGPLDAGIVRGDAWHDAYIGAGGGEFELYAGALEAYIPTTASFFGFWRLGRKRRGGCCWRSSGCCCSRETRAGMTLRAMKARVLPTQAIGQLKGETTPIEWSDELNCSRSRVLTAICFRCW